MTQKVEILNNMRKILFKAKAMQGTIIHFTTNIL